jgi:hypothetical protein
LEFDETIARGCVVDADCATWVVEREAGKAPVVEAAEDGREAGRVSWVVATEVA